MQQLIVGLGNPGEEYRYTRHNVGTWLVEALAERFSVILNPKKKFCALVGSFEFQHQKIFLCVPQLFMNESGRSVRSIQNFYKIPISNITIAHDELDFPTQVVKLKNGGGHGGHNGLRNIQDHLGSNEFNRCRIGIGHPNDKNQVSTYVLSRPNVQDKQNIDEKIKHVVEHIEPILLSDWQQAKLLIHSTN